MYSRVPRAARHFPRPVNLLVVLGCCCLAAIEVLALLVVQPGPASTLVGLLLALLPIPLLVALILYLDRLEPEPRALLAATFGAGAGIAAITALVGRTLGTAMITTPELAPHVSIAAPVGAGPAIGGAFVAETLNALVLLALLASRRAEIDSVEDGMVYGSMVGLGFALVANLYAYSVAWNSGAGALADEFARRGVFGPVFQALFTSLTGLGVAYAAARPAAANRYLAIVGGWAAAVALDALWSHSVGESGAGLLVTYLVLLAVLLALVTAVLRGRRRVVRLIGNFLPDFEDPEVVTEEDVRMLASLRLRRLGRQWARLNLGINGRRAMTEYQLAATELAMACSRESLGQMTPETYVRHRDDSLTLMRAAAEIVRSQEQLQPPPWIALGSHSVFVAVPPTGAGGAGERQGSQLAKDETDISGATPPSPDDARLAEARPGASGSGQSSGPPSGGRQTPAATFPGADPERSLKGQCPDRVPLGEPFSVLVSIVADGTGGARLKDFRARPGGEDILLVLHAPGLQVLSGQRRTVHVPLGGGSEPTMFELAARSPGVCRMSITAWLGGTYLGELAIETEARRDHLPGEGHRDFGAVVDTTAAAGAVGLVVRYDPGQNAYRFEFRDEDNPDEVLSRLAYEPGPRVERLIAELDRLAKSGAGFSASETRDYLREAGAALWRELVPEQLRRQFWERQGRISQLSILTDRDTVPWELLYPLDPGHDAGFLVEQFPVTRLAFGRRPARSLSLTPAWFVLPDGSPPRARDEVSELMRLLQAQPPPGPEPVIGELAPLLELIRTGHFGLLHFACHNAFDTASGSSISLNRQLFTPTLMTTAAIDQALAGSSPTIFINACRSAGFTPAYHQLDGWAGKFLEAGAGAFIGTLWAVRDSTAHGFASDLYGSLRAGNPLGQAVMQARRAAAREPGDPTWLAYAVYGDPRATLR